MVVPCFSCFINAGYIGDIDDVNADDVDDDVMMLLLIVMVVLEVVILLPLLFVDGAAPSLTAGFCRTHLPTGSNMLQIAGK